MLESIWELSYVKIGRCYFRKYCKFILDNKFFGSVSGEFIIFSILRDYFLLFFEGV